MQCSGYDLHIIETKQVVMLHYLCPKCDIDYRKVVWRKWYSDGLCWKAQGVDSLENAIQGQNLVWLCYVVTAHVLYSKIGRTEHQFSTVIDAMDRKYIYICSDLPLTISNQLLRMHWGKCMPNLNIHWRVCWSALERSVCQAWRSIGFVSLTGILNFGVNGRSKSQWCNRRRWSEN